MSPVRLSGFVATKDDMKKALAEPAEPETRPAAQVRLAGELGRLTKDELYTCHLAAKRLEATEGKHVQSVWHSIARIFELEHDSR